MKPSLIGLIVAVIALAVATITFATLYAVETHSSRVLLRAIHTEPWRPPHEISAEFDVARQTLLEPFPRTLHCVFIPWDKNQTLADDLNDIPEKVQQQVEDLELRAATDGWNVQFWTFQRLQEFVVDTFGEKLWEFLWQKVDRPVQAVDFLRQLLLYEFGGVSFQLGVQIVSDTSLDDIFVPEGAETRMFVEMNLSPSRSARATTFKVRNGTPRARGPHHAAGHECTSAFRPLLGAGPRRDAQPRHAPRAQGL